MSLLIGTGQFIIRHVMSKLPKRGSMLGIARMGMNWSIDDVLKHLRANNIEFNKKAADRLRAQNRAYTSKDFFELLGFEDYQDIDFDSTEGCTIIHDMNHPLPKKYENRFDFVIENGTIEHIFDIKTAVGNIAKAVKVGGLVCHVSPLDAFNHGFYNFSINFFNDFYRANGFENREFFQLRWSANWAQDQNVLIDPLPYTHEEFYVRSDVYASPYNKLGIGFIAVKKQHFPDTVVPIQAAYDQNLRLPSVLNRLERPR